MIHIKRLDESIRELTQYYHVADCENENDIRIAEREVEESGGIVDDVIDEIKDEEIDDYYEGRNWYIKFHCTTQEELEETCRKLGIYIRK